jgi:hypothetical protein
MIKYTHHFLAKLEDLVAETPYTLRYEKGQFRSGYCLLNEHRIIVVNKYFPLEGRINSLVEIIRSLPLDPQQLSDKNRQLLALLQQATLFDRPAEP